MKTTIIPATTTSAPEPEFPAIYTKETASGPFTLLVTRLNFGVYLQYGNSPEMLGSDGYFPSGLDQAGYKRLPSPVTIRFEGWSA